MSSKNTKIFIVDDDPVFTRIILQKLNKNKVTNIQTFTNGYECISQLHQEPQIIILDHFLQYELGLNILKDIKEYNSEISVVYVSSQEKGSIVLKALRYGAVEYLEKNVEEINTLVDVIEKIRA